MYFVLSFYIVKGVVSGEIYTAGKKIYTAAGSDGIDKYHLWSSAPQPAAFIIGVLAFFLLS